MNAIDSLQHSRDHFISRWGKSFQAQAVLQMCLMLLVLSTSTVPLFAQRGPGRGRGYRGGRGADEPAAKENNLSEPGHANPTTRGRGHDQQHESDHQVIEFLLTNHTKINRTVKELPDGVETLTESEDPAIAAKIREHVLWMVSRIEETRPIRMRDPLFAEIFRHTDKIEMVRKETSKGVWVKETSKDPYVAKLIQAHAKAVSGFVAKGFAEAMRNHDIPLSDENNSPSGQAESRQPINPKIEDYGPVFNLPTAAQQPRADSRLCVDVTKGGDPAQLLASLEKVARFINIYEGAGAKSATVKIAIVLHGDATLAVLNDEAYAKAYGTKSNPNLKCLRELHHAGVEIYVCGQSLIHKGAQPEQVVVFADVAVSALTSLANLQSDGYAYIPLK